MMSPANNSGDSMFNGNSPEKGPKKVENERTRNTILKQTSVLFFTHFEKK